MKRLSLLSRIGIIALAAAFLAMASWSTGPKAAGGHVGFEKFSSEAEFQQLAQRGNKGRGRGAETEEDRKKRIEKREGRGAESRQEREDRIGERGRSKGKGRKGKGGGDDDDDKKKKKDKKAKKAKKDKKVKKAKRGKK